MGVNIAMVDLKTQYLRLKTEIDAAISAVLESSRFIGGKEVTRFSERLCAYLNVQHSITCGNGTDALQIALMALDLRPGDEVIVPAFTYIAPVEVIALLGLKPVLVDVKPDTFNIDPDVLVAAINSKTKAIIPVHLFGQSADMASIMNIAKKHGLKVVEDNAQSIGTRFEGKHTGTLGDIGCISFFPSKNLGAYGDGGALTTNDSGLAARLKSICSHGQYSRKYYHDEIGVNSRLDALQAAILNVKLGHLDDFVAARRSVAAAYDKALNDVADITIPFRTASSTHVFHQYTLKIKAGKRDALKAYLSEQGIPSMIYYPMPIYTQRAYTNEFPATIHLPVTEQLCQEVLSLPMHTEMTEDQIEYIIHHVKQFFS
ncbi:MAG: DegT/DnrJ/EryC1/StrS family aminotransferase [Saprospiraceae bacterium]|nr:DegT/DnrJ/EryC1/StrS family aminotransferase [Saprospiraceae bacterium]